MEAPGDGLLSRLNTLRGTKTTFLAPNRYNGHPILLSSFNTGLPQYLMIKFHWTFQVDHWQSQSVVCLDKTLHFTLLGPCTQVYYHLK